VWEGGIATTKSQNGGRLSKCGQLSIKEIRCYLGEDGRLHGKIGADDGTGEEDEECRDEE
jgi:hypothetical protein